MFYAFTFLVPCCNVRYDFHIKTMFSSSLPSVICWKDLLMLFVLVYVHSSAQRVLTMSNMAGFLKKTRSADPSRAPVFTPCIGRVGVAHIFCFVCCVFCFVCLHTVSSTQCCLCLWIVNVACVCRLSMLPVSVDCQRCLCL